MMYQPKEEIYVGPNLTHGPSPFLKILTKKGLDISFKLVYSVRSVRPHF
jgi:hypothetical protein